MMLAFFIGTLWGFWFTTGVATALVMDEGEAFSWAVACRWAWLVLLGPITMVRALLDFHEGCGDG